MSSQNLIIYNYRELYNILSEISLNLNFETTFIDNENSLKEKITNLNYYIVISNKKYLDNINLLVLDNFPINIFKLIEKLNTEFLKLQFNSQSELKVKNYIIDLNSREIQINKKKIKLTEKEVDMIIYLSKLKKPTSIDSLKKEVWNYQSDVDTHTIETHIYRLRKKFFLSFGDKNFIVSKKNGYEIK